MREILENCLISTSGLDEFRPQPSSLDKNRRNRLDDNDSYASEVLASRLKDFRPNQPCLVGSRRRNLIDNNDDYSSEVVALDLDGNRPYPTDQTRKSRRNRLIDDDNFSELTPDNNEYRPDPLSNVRNSGKNKGLCDSRGSGSFVSDHAEFRRANLARPRNRCLEDDDECSSEIFVKTKGRPSMKHPTIVHGEVTR